jgi:hypothetical protein
MSSVIVRDRLEIVSASREVPHSANQPYLDTKPEASNMKTEQLQDVILTLQYCLETFEQACQCGCCDPCTKGRKDIARAIRTIENIQLQQRKLFPSQQRRPGGAK